MALWNEKSGAAAAPASPNTVADLHPRSTDKPAPEPAVVPEAARRPAPRVEAKDSVICADLTIEGKIQGTGNLKMAGSFKGDVQLDGNVSIEAGAHLEGQVRANAVVVGGELKGNIEGAKHIDVLQSGVIVGDVKASSITVAAGSRMRGHVEFGWGDEATKNHGAKGNSYQ
jgi:cytoskeletal protein CcmA (bactofilin family)